MSSRARLRSQAQRRLPVLSPPSSSCYSAMPFLADAIPAFLLTDARLNEFRDPRLPSCVPSLFFRAASSRCHPAMTAEPADSDPSIPEGAGSPLETSILQRYFFFPLPSRLYIPTYTYFSPIMLSPTRVPDSADLYKATAAAAEHASARTRNVYALIASWPPSPRALADSFYRGVEAQSFSATPRLTCRGLCEP